MRLSAAGSVLRLLRTVRWLRGQQVCGQIRERLRGFLERPERWQPAAPTLPELRWEGLRDFQPPGSQ